MIADKNEEWSLRDWFAAQVLAGWHQDFIQLTDNSGTYEQRMARVAFQLADAMLAERTRKRA